MSHADPDASAGADPIVLVRPAETRWSRDGLHTGRTDIPLTDAGRAAARSLPQRLASWDFAHVFVSPSARARETCQLAGLDGRAQTDARLLEWDYGAYEGLTTAQIRAERPDWNLWRDDCPQGEDAAMVGARADGMIAHVKALEGAVAIFSHGHALRVLGARWIELGPTQGARLGLSTGAVCVLGYERGARIVSAWNLLE